MLSPPLRWLQKGLPILLALLALALFSSASLVRLDFWLYDGLTRLSPAKPQASDLLVIAIDEKSLSTLGRWPWPREYHAALISRLNEARAVGLDIVLAEATRESPESDRALAEAIRRNGKVITPVFPERIDDRLQETRSIPEIAAASARLGHTDFERDSDGKIRRVFLRAGLGYPHHPAFAQALMDQANGLARPGTDLEENPQPLPLPWVRDTQVMVPFNGGLPPFKRIPYSEALKLPPAAFAGKIVLIGATAAGTGDTHVTPISGNSLGTPGVEINAYLTYAIAHDLLIHVPEPAIRIALFMLSLAALDFFLSRLKHALLAGYFIASLALLASSALLLLYAHIWLSAALPATLLMLSGLLRFVISSGRLQHQASTDGLTGIPNRRRFDEVFAEAFHHHLSRHKPLALLILDVDNFKGYNDHYGHYEGDIVLQRIARELQQMFKARGEMVARLGGEEFGVLLQGRNLEAALAEADRFRQKLESLELPHVASKLRKVTCSIGVAARVPGAQDNLRSLFEAADSGLYLAKDNGRNRVCTAPELPKHLS